MRLCPDCGAKLERQEYWYVCRPCAMKWEVEYGQNGPYATNKHELVEPMRADTCPQCESKWNTQQAPGESLTFNEPQVWKCKKCSITFPARKVGAHKTLLQGFPVALLDYEVQETPTEIENPRIKRVGELTEEFQPYQLFALQRIKNALRDFARWHLGEGANLREAARAYDTLGQEVTW